jgi:hypothetical protein
MVQHNLGAFWQANFAFAFMAPPVRLSAVTSGYCPATEHPQATIRRPKGIKNAASLHAHVRFRNIRAERKPPGDLQPAPADPLGRNDPRIEGDRCPTLLLL